MHVTHEHIIAQSPMHTREHLYFRSVYGKVPEGKSGLVHLQHRGQELGWRHQGTVWPTDDLVSQVMNLNIIIVCRWRENSSVFFLTFAMWCPPTCILRIPKSCVIITLNGSSVYMYVLWAYTYIPRYRYNFRVAPDTDLAGYQANIFAGYSVWPDIRLNSNIEFFFRKKCTFI